MNRWFRRKRTIKLYLFLTSRNFSIHENFSISKICSEKLKLFRLEIVYPTSSCSQSFERLTIARKILAREIVRSRCFEYPAESLRSNLELKAVWDPVSGSLEIFDRTNFMDIKLLCLSPPSS